jgi:hypothetical protein
MAPLLPVLAAGARSLLSRAVSPRAAQPAPIRELGPLAARALLVARDGVSSTTDNADSDPSKGGIDPHNINNKAFFALFALIGVAFIVTGIWFFFWAKNGGFYFKETDWDDYKTTVLRRRGPNGTILSNATPSTNLGGGSIYKDIEDDDSTEYTGGLTVSHLSGDTGSTLSGITAGPSDIGAREKRRAKRDKREREREKKKDRKARSGRKVGEDGALVDEKAEADAKDAVRQYRHERPARVGGLNKEAEGSTWDGSTNPSESTAGTESLLSGRQTTPTSTPTKSKEGKSSSGSGATPAGIRKVYSVADRNAAQESERIRSEARRLQEKGRASRSSAAASASRNFSFRHGDSIVEESVGRSEVSATSSGGSGSDLGTKAYHHPIPGLTASSAAGTDIVDYADERRKKRGAGYRRDRERRE